MSPSDLVYFNLEQHSNARSLRPHPSQNAAPVSSRSNTASVSTWSDPGKKLKPSAWVKRHSPDLTSASQSLWNAAKPQLR